MRYVETIRKVKTAHKRKGMNQAWLQQERPVHWRLHTVLTLNSTFTLHRAGDKTFTLVWFILILTRHVAWYWAFNVFYLIRDEQIHSESETIVRTTALSNCRLSTVSFLDLALAFLIHTLRYIPIDCRDTPKAVYKSLILIYHINNGMDFESLSIKILHQSWNNN